MSKVVRNKQTTRRIFEKGWNERILEGQDIPACGKDIPVTAMMFLRFEDGQVVEIWEDFYEFGLRQQLTSERE